MRQEAVSNNSALFIIIGIIIITLIDIVIIITSSNNWKGDDSFTPLSYCSEVWNTVQSMK